MNILSENDAKCRISEGCFYALGSFKRYKLVKVHQEDDNGSDFNLKRIEEVQGKIRDLDTVMDFQLKCTESWEDDGESIKYALKSKNYNDIIHRNSAQSTPLVLILLCLPKGDANWVQANESAISIREKMYWYHTESTDLLPNEESTKTIKVPKTNLLSIESFDLMVSQFQTKAV